MKAIHFIVIGLLIMGFFFTGCRTIYVGGSGKVGNVHGHGEIDIPIPEKDMDPSEK